MHTCTTKSKSKLNPAHPPNNTLCTLPLKQTVQLVQPCQNDLLGESTLIPISSCLCYVILLFVRISSLPWWLHVKMAELVFTLVTVISLCLSAWERPGFVIAIAMFVIDLTEQKNASVYSVVFYNLRLHNNYQKGAYDLWKQNEDVVRYLIDRNKAGNLLARHAPPSQFNIISIIYYLSAILFYLFFHLFIW